MSETNDTPAGIQKVIVTDIQMTFGSMVVFMIKGAIAIIPAAIILTIIFAIVTGVLGGLSGN